jgi:hypothetical protein
MVAVQGPDLMAHPLHIHTYIIHTYIQDGDRIQSLKRYDFKYKPDGVSNRNRTTENVKKHNICIIMNGSTSPLLTVTASTMSLNWSPSIAVFFLFFQFLVWRVPKFFEPYHATLWGDFPTFALHYVMVDTKFLAGGGSRFICSQHIPQSRCFTASFATCSSHSWYSSWLCLIRQVRFSFQGP